MNFLPSNRHPILYFVVIVFFCQVALAQDWTTASWSLVRPEKVKGRDFPIHQVHYFPDAKDFTFDVKIHRRSLEEKETFFNEQGQLNQKFAQNETRVLTRSSIGLRSILELGLELDFSLGRTDTQLDKDSILSVQGNKRFQGLYDPILFARHRFFEESDGKAGGDIILKVSPGFLESSFDSSLNAGNIGSVARGGSQISLGAKFFKQSGLVGVSLQPFYVWQSSQDRIDLSDNTVLNFASRGGLGLEFKLTYEYGQDLTLQTLFNGLAYTRRSFGQLGLEHNFEQEDELMFNVGLNFIKPFFNERLALNILTLFEYRDMGKVSNNQGPLSRSEFSGYILGAGIDWRL